MELVSVDATPDKSLIMKLGQVGYKAEQAIAELVDNAIDARIDGKTESIEIGLDRSSEIAIRDDGKGMDLERLRRAWTLGGASKKGKIGMFGVGLKSASSSLGRHIDISTTVEGSGYELTLTYDEEEWLKDKNAKWNNVKVRRHRAEKGTHGTNIRISQLRSSSFPQPAKLREEFGIRYGPYLNEGIRISINGKQCAAKEPTIADGTRKKVAMTTLDGISITGWIALLKKRSIKGNYGIHIYTNGRLIKPYAKFGIPRHPSAARVIGSVTLDNVPVNVFKTGFLTESQEYKAAANRFKNDNNVKETMRMAARNNQKDHDIASVLNPQENQRQPRLLRLGETKSERLLQNMGTNLIEYDFGPGLRLEDGGSGLYRLEKHGEQLEIVVNRQSKVFQAFKNPLHLLVMIQAEVETFFHDPDMGDFIEARNIKWENRIDKLANGAPRGRLQNIDLLSAELRHVCKYMLEHGAHRFQFTALSTLTEFLNQAYRRHVYTVYTTRGDSQGLESMISKHGECFPLTEPTYPQLSTAMDAMGDKSIIIIREYANIPNSIVASLEKSWVDLFFETTKKGIQFYKKELEMVEALLNSEMATKERIMSWAKRRKIETVIGEYLEVQHCES